MQLIKLHDDFYRIEDAFDKATIKKLRKYFKHRDCWQQLGQGTTKNGGYLMFNPTQHEHGMRSPVTNRRMSIYQSYRITEEPSPIW